MHPFPCGNCHQPVFFENSVCVACDWQLGFEPDGRQMHAFGNAAENIQTVGAVPSQAFSVCANRRHGVCNWLVDKRDAHELCRSCRLTVADPALLEPANLPRWFAVEQAKRRLLFTLSALNLMPTPKLGKDDRLGLSFRLATSSADEPALTGHAEGVITINLAEADAVERERQRVAFDEPVRTMLGHMRHEISHYLQYRWLAATPLIDQCRRMFGDERIDYAGALAAYHAEGPRPDWQAHFISAYASAHPWEDWAETCAHVLLVFDAIETASAWGLRLPLADGPSADSVSAPIRTMVLSQWLPVAQFLNAMNRSLGLPDSYPFLVPDAVLEKMEIVQQLLARASDPARA